MTPLAAIHVARKALGMDEETYRAFLLRETGKDSAKDLNPNEMRHVIKAFGRAGYVAAEASRRPSPAFVRKAQALWIAAWNLDLVSDRSDRALRAFVKRQTGLDHPAWVKDAKAQRAVVEALKGMTARAGVDWREGLAPGATSAAGHRIARAQFRMIDGEAGDPFLARQRFERAAAAISGREPFLMTKEADWIPVMNAFGATVRANRKAGR
ncbi:MAG: regulatory protein GemA [Rhizobiaceae bacterium]